MPRGAVRGEESYLRGGEGEGGGEWGNRERSYAFIDVLDGGEKRGEGE